MNQTQQEALTQIFSGQSGGHFAVLASFIGEVLGITTAAIDYKADGRSRSLTVGNLARWRFKLLKGVVVLKVVVAAIVW